jgi:ABC-type branched-subunit amino acid transport system ATPase component
MSALLRVEGLSRHFGGVRAVDAVSFGVREGEIVGLIGPNGAGKTTVLNLLSGLLRPTAGLIAFAGARLDRLPPHRIARAGVARTYQNIRLFGGLSALDNAIVGTHTVTRAPFVARLLFAPAVRREEQAARATARRLLERVGLAHRAEARATSLPYGEQRRLEIARALAAAGQTILLIEHNMQVVMGVCDRIVVLNFGRKIAEGTPAEIGRDRAVIAAYLGEEDDEGSQV